METKTKGQDPHNPFHFKREKYSAACRGVQIEKCQSGGTEKNGPSARVLFCRSTTEQEIHLSNCSKQPMRDNSGKRGGL